MYSEVDVHLWLTHSRADLSIIDTQGGGRMSTVYIQQCVYLWFTCRVVEMSVVNMQRGRSASVIDM